MSRAVLALVLALAASGCISMRVAAGPTVTTDGDVGVEVTAGMSFGLNKPRSSLVLLGVDGGGTYWPGDNSIGGVAVDSIDHVNVIEKSGEPIIRAGGRFGLRNIPDQHAGAFGVGVAIIPSGKRSASSGGYDGGKGGFDWWTSWSQSGFGIDIAFMYLFAEGTSVGYGRVAAIFDYTTLAR